MILTLDPSINAKIPKLNSEKSFTGNSKEFDLRYSIILLFMNIY